MADPFLLENSAPGIEFVTKKLAVEIARNDEIASGHWNHFFPTLNVLADSLTTLGLGLDSSLNPNFRKAKASTQIYADERR